MQTWLGVAFLLAAAHAADPAKVDGPVVGVDLGTTYSCVAVFKNGRVEVIANDQGNRVTPSYVAFTEGERLVGDSAKTQAALNPTNTVYDMKRLIGRRFSDSHVQADMELWPFKVVEAAGGVPAIEVSVRGETKRMLPQEVSSMVLGKMRDHFIFTYSARRPSPTLRPSGRKPRPGDRRKPSLRGRR